MVDFIKIDELNIFIFKFNDFKWLKNLLNLKIKN